MSNSIHRVLVVTLLLLTSCFLANAANITAITSGNWNSTLTWSTFSVPTAADNVTIPNGLTVTQNIAAAVASTMTVNTGGKLIISNNDKLTLGGSLTVNGTLTSGTSSSLLIGGNLTNTGTMTIGLGILEFDGAANSTISASGGTYTIGGIVLLDMGSTATYLDVKDPNFIAGINAGGVYYFTFTRGTWKEDNTATLNNAYAANSNNSLTIPYGAVVESDAGVMNLATKGQTGKVLLSGELLLNGGTVNVETGQTATQDFNYYVNGGTPQLYINSGTLNVGSGFNPRTTGTDYIDFHMTGGTMEVAYDQASAEATFQLENLTGGKTFMSGGTIILQEPGTGSNPDLDMGGPNVSPYSVTGGTVQLGTASMTSSPNFFGIMPYATTNYPNIVALPGKNETVAAHVEGSFNFLSLYINPNTTFDASNMDNVTITSSDGAYAFDDEGTFTPGGNMVTFAGTASQTITSSSLSNVPFDNITVSNTGGNVVVGVPTTVSTSIAFTSGKLDATTNPVTLSNGSNAITGTSASSYVITGDGTTNTGYLAIQKLPKNTTTTFPIGNATYYFPATINPGNTNNTAYQASVYVGVTTNAKSTGASQSAAILATEEGVTWNMNRTTGGTSTATLGLNWGSSGATYEGSYFKNYGTGIGIQQYSGGWQPETGSGSVASTSATSSFSSFTQFSIIGTPTAIILPITLGEFDAVKQGQTAVLNWGAYPDGQAASFTIERSADGVTWTSIGLIQADAAATTETNYTFTDTKPQTGQDDYRLFIQNADGSISYSSIRALEFIGSTQQLSMYPNPANAALIISSAASSQRLVFRLVNTAGQILQVRTIEAGGAGYTTMNTGGYPAGVYYVETVAGQQLLQTSAVMIMH